MFHPFKCNPVAAKEWNIQVMTDPYFWYANANEISDFRVYASAGQWYVYVGFSIHGGSPKNGWLTRENPIKIGDLGVSPFFRGIPIYGNPYVYIYIYTYVYIYIHMYIMSIYIYTYVCYVYIYICTYIYIHIHNIHIYIYMYIYICVYIYMYIYVYIYMYDFEKFGEGLPSRKMSSLSRCQMFSPNWMLLC